MPSRLRDDFAAALRDLASRVPTPFYAYDVSLISDAVARYRRAFAAARIMYAAKANSRSGLLRLMRSWGLGLDTVSLGELLHGLHAGFAAEQMVYNGPVKTEAQLARLARLETPTVVADSAVDLRRIARFLPGAPVLLRLNPDLPVDTHPHLATGRGDSQFGVLAEEWPEVFALGRSLGLQMRGLHVHIGSSLNNAADFSARLDVLERLHPHSGDLQVLDLGGGFGLEMRPEELAPAMLSEAARFGAELWIEPGRALVAEAGVLVTRVWGEKRTRRRYLLLDAGMTTMLRPLLYGASHPVYPLYHSSQSAEYDLAGPACESGDVLARGVRLPLAAEGDLLAIAQAGAYGAAMSLNYLDQPHPGEYAWDGQRWRVWARPQSYEQLWRNEPEEPEFV